MDAAEARDSERDRDTADIEDNTDSVFTCGPSCRFQQLSEQALDWSSQTSSEEQLQRDVEGKEQLQWDVEGEEQLQRDVEGCHCMDRRLTTALQQCRWERLVGLSRICDDRQRSMVVQQAASQGQWWCVGRVVRMGVPSAVRGEVACQALGSGEVEVVREMVDLGVGAEWRGALCRQAASLQQWDMVTRLAATGLGREVREVLKSALDHRQLGCAVALMTMVAGHRQDLEDCVTALIGSQQCDAAFVMELVKACDDPAMLHTALGESLERSQWQLVSNLVMLNVSDSTKETVCDRAAAEHQWEVVIQLLRDGVSPAEWIISELFEAGMAPQLLSHVPAGQMHGGVRALLLHCAVRLGNAVLLLQIVQREPVPDRELTYIIASAVHLRQENVLLQLLRNHSRSRRLFKQFFPSEAWSDKEWDEEILWTFHCLDDGGEKDLALWVAMTTRDGCFVPDFFRSNMPEISLKKRKFQRAVSHMYAFCYKEFEEVATELAARSHYHRRYLFRLALGQGDFGLAAQLCGPGISKKDLKLALPEILNQELSLHLVLLFNEKMEPLFGRQYFVQLVTRCALQRLSDVTAGQDKFIVLYRTNQDSAFRQRIFRSAVKQSIRTGGNDLFVRICRVHFRGADLKGNGQLKGDWRFACLKALRAEMSGWILDTYRRKPFYDMVFMSVVLNIVFGKRVFQLDTVAFLKDVCSIGSYSRYSDFVIVFVLVLDRWLISKCWQEHAPAMNKWLFSYQRHDFPEFMFRTQAAHRRSWVERAQWCLRKSYHHTAFVLALGLEDMSMLEGMLTQQHYQPPFNLESCIKRFVSLGQFSIAVALLRHRRRETFPLEISRELSRKTLAKRCLDGGVSTWAVVFTIPDWNKIHALVHTGQHPAALNVALMEAMKYKKLDLFEDLIDGCTDPDGVVREALLMGKWDCAEKLMDRCTDPETLRRLFTQAVHHGRLEVVRSVIRRVDPNVIREDRIYQRTSTLRCVFEDMPSNVLQMLCLFVKAGVSAVDRSGVLVQCDCPLIRILIMYYSYTLPQRVKLTDVTRLVIQSGAVSYRMLDERRQDSALHNWLLANHDQGWRQCYADVVQAAATPWRLEHLARLTVSAAIGCHPGRPARIDSLPVPERIRDLLNFKDVTEQYEPVSSTTCSTSSRVSYRILPL